MILNRDGRVIANVSQPVIAFDNASDYETWKDSLPSADAENFFIVIKKYQQGPGILEFDGEGSLSNVPKYSNTLYVNCLDNSLWRYKTETDSFVRLTTGEV